MAYSQKTGTSIDGSDMKEKMLWLSSVVAGILICVTVYHLTGAISSVCFKVYSKLYNAQKVEWNNRGFSTVHAFIVAVAGLHPLLFSDLFKEDSGEGHIIDRRSTYSNTTFGISIGYFLSDLAMILWRYPALGGKEYILHHGLSLFSIICALVSGQGHMYILMVLFSEITTPFVNLRWYLDVSGEKKSKLYVYNGIALFFGWLVETSHTPAHLRPSQSFPQHTSTDEEYSVVVPSIDQPSSQEEVPLRTYARRTKS